MVSQCFCCVEEKVIMGLNMYKGKILHLHIIFPVHRCFFDATRFYCKTPGNSKYQQKPMVFIGNPLKTT